MPDFDMAASLHQQVQAASRERIQEALLALLTPYFRPTFGTGKTVEHEVSVLRALKLLGVVSVRATELDLVMTLRVTRAKARALLYHAQLADVQDMAALDERVREVLARPRIGKISGRDDEPITWLLDVPFPLVADRIRQLVRQEGYISDGSFSPNLIKLPSTAYGAVVACLVPPQKREALLAAARESVKASHSNDLGTILGGVLGHLGKQIAGDVGRQLAQEVGKDLYDLLKTGSAALLKRLPPIGDSR
jgi:hypothetical protein